MLKGQRVEIRVCRGEICESVDYSLMAYGQVVEIDESRINDLINALDDAANRLEDEE